MQLFLRIIKTAWIGFWRNGWLSLISIFIMVQVLLLVGIFLSLNVGINRTIQQINQQIDLTIFFQDYATDTSIADLQARAQTVPGVKAVKYISREDALAKYTETSQHNKDLLTAIDGDASFFPISVEIALTDPNLLEQVREKIKAEDANNIISTTSWDKNHDMIKKLRRFNQLFAWGNIALSTILLIVALLIIFNTIRITIFTRKEEIEIMKLVGATDWYIRWPFVLEGMLYGFIGALIAFLLTISAYYAAIWMLGNNYWSLPLGDNALSGIGYWTVVKLFGFQLFFGVLVSSFSSYLATKRYLRI